MKVVNLGAQKSVLNSFVSEIRDVNVQGDAMRFRRNIERIGEIIGYELSQSLNYKESSIKTPLGNKMMFLPTDDIVLCTILRAGLPLHLGLLNYFDHAESAFISAYRRHLNATDFEIKVEYFASPSIEGKTLILADPMLATGRSLVSVYEGLKKHGNPDKIHLVCVMGSTEGIAYIENYFPINTTLWIAAVDNKLNDKGYIVPGLGDAGDLAYGQKL